LSRPIARCRRRTFTAAGNATIASSHFSGRSTDSGPGLRQFQRPARRQSAPGIDLATPEVWFVCGSQHLYGPGPLKQVAANAREIAAALRKSPKLPLKTP